MTLSRRGHNAEAWILVILAVLLLAGAAGGFLVWSRAVAARMTAEAAEAQASAGRAAVQRLREAEAEARAAEAQKVTAEEKPGGAMELNRILRTAIDSADTPERRASVRELLDRAALDIDAGRIKDTPEAMGTLRMTLGTGYRSLGSPDLALPHLRAALDLRRKALGERHPDTIRAQMEVEEAERAAASR